MLTKLRIQNFKQFDDVEIELGPVTVFVGPNNSGKTTALQALALWYAGYLEWSERVDKQIDPRLTARSTDSFGYAPDDYEPINRYDLTAVPVTRSRLLWRNLLTGNGDAVPMFVEASGVREQDYGESVGKLEPWTCPMQFTFANEESFHVSSAWSPIYLEWFPKILLLPSMSGITSVEPLVQPGRLNVLLGEGRTSETLRNLCFRLHTESSDTGQWQVLVRQMHASFGVELQPPVYIAERGELHMSYKDRHGYVFDLPSAGRGMLQTLLLLAYLYTYPGAVLLLDEPDAHLEIIRQREIYRMLTDAAASQGSQIILATHSEVILKEAFERKDIVIAFTGRPHRLTDVGNFVKSLSLIPAEDFVLADQNGWVLYCEGETDALILRAFAARLQHEVFPSLQLAFTKDIKGNRPNAAKDHFSGLQEAYPTLHGIAVFDRVSKGKLQDVPPGLRIVSWTRREIENYLMQPETLMAYARASSEAQEEAARREQIMRDVVQGNTPPVALEDRTHRFWLNTKASDDYLDPIFKDYSSRAGLPLQLRKADYHLLAQYIPAELIDPEIAEKLDAILQVARKAKPEEE